MPEIAQGACTGKLEVDISTSSYLLLEVTCPRCKAVIGSSLTRIESGSPAGKAFKCKPCGLVGVYRLEVTATYSVPPA